MITPVAEITARSAGLPIAFLTFRRTRPPASTRPCTSGTAGPGAGRAGLLLFPPAEHRPATFDGAASGHKRTMIRAYDRSVLDPNLYLSSKVYTDPDTIAGDSGAALIDSDDRIVGFAVSRTPLGAPLEFSTWAWAEQVLTAHGLA